MVWEKKPASRLTAHDWAVLGHEYYLNDLACLPSRRLDVPLPADVEGIHALAHRFAGMSEELHRIARLASSARSSISETDGYLIYQRNQFKDLRREWETELREAEMRQAEEAGKVARIGKVG